MQCSDLTIDILSIIRRRRTVAFFQKSGRGRLCGVGEVDYLLSVCNCQNIGVLGLICSTSEFHPRTQEARARSYLFYEYVWSTALLATPKAANATWLYFQRKELRRVGRVSLLEGEKSKGDEHFATSGTRLSRVVPRLKVIPFSLLSPFSTRSEDTTT